MVAKSTLTGICEAFWRTETAEGLFKLFAEVLVSHCDVGKFSLLHAELKQGRITCRPFPQVSPPKTQLASFPEEVIAALPASPVDGPCLLRWQDESFFYRFFGLELGSKGYACLWEKSSNRKKQHFSQFLSSLLAREIKWQLKLDEAHTLIYQDQLTGLYNFRYFELALANELKRAYRYQTTFSLLFLDIDRFKSINDRYGHEVGNLVLQQLAHTLKAELRSADTLARFGGDEFIALLIGVDEASGITIGERLQRRIALKRFGHPEQDIKVSLSLGLASYPKHGSEEKSLIQCADLNMYRTKKLHLSPEYHSL